MGNDGVDRWPINNEASLCAWCGSRKRSKGKEKGVEIVETILAEFPADLGVSCIQQMSLQFVHHKAELIVSLVLGPVWQMLS